MTAATAVINWKQLAENNKPLLVVKTEPDSIYTGDSVKVLLYSAYPHDLISPYNGLGAKNIEASKLIIETVELSGSREMRTQYPIKSVATIRALLPIVDETTRAIVVEAGDSVRDWVSVVNQQLKLTDETLKLHGSIEVRYNTFDAQVWQHKSFAKKGRALLFAHNLTFGDYENVPLTINERSNSNDGIKIEAWVTQPKRAFSPYHTVIIYPASKRLKVVADYGKVTFREKVTNTIKAEEITFSGKEANAAYFINKLIKVTGVFYDDKLNEIEPFFRVDNGILKSNIECYGSGIISYETEGLIYDYDAEVTITLPPTPSTNIRIGKILAQEKGKIGIGATYTVPQWQNAALQQMDFYTVSRKVLSQESNSFEYPPNWSSGDNTFPNIAVGDLPIVGEPTFIINKVIEAGHVDISGSIDYNSYSNRFYDPYAGSPENPDAVYEIQPTIPSDIVDTYLIDKLNEAIDEAKARWGIA